MVDQPLLSHWFSLWTSEWKKREKNFSDDYRPTHLPRLEEWWGAGLESVGVSQTEWASSLTPKENK